VGDEGGDEQTRGDGPPRVEGADVHRPTRAEQQRHAEHGHRSPDAEQHCVELPGPIPAGQDQRRGGQTHEEPGHRARTGRQDRTGHCPGAPYPPARRRQRQEGGQPERHPHRERHPARHQVAEDADDAEQPTGQRPPRPGAHQQLHQHHGGQDPGERAEQSRAGRATTQPRHRCRGEQAVAERGRAAVPAEIQDCGTVPGEEAGPRGLRGQVRTHRRCEQERRRSRQRRQHRAHNSAADSLKPQGRAPLRRGTAG
jgi:hypothetical protein